MITIYISGKSISMKSGGCEVGGWGIGVSGFGGMEGRCPRNSGKVEGGSLGKMIQCIVARQLEYLRLPQSTKIKRGTISTNDGSIRAPDIILLSR